MKGRAGTYIRQPGGYRAFVPAPLPPNPPVEVDLEIVRLLSEADQALGRLDGVTRILPEPDLFVAMYVLRESVLSSQIEGTISTLDDALVFELQPNKPDLPKDVDEVVNHVRAMNYGLDRIDSFPLSLRLIREIHQELLSGVRGAEKQPGDFRSTQNWIGPGGAPLSQAAFIPPAPADMLAALDNFEHFIRDDRELPALIHTGLAHAQFETIHPFLDGNGRVGRLLITFLLCHRQVLHRPLLYLSVYLRRHRAEYYDRLTAIREDGNWEGWLRFFLRGVKETAEEAGKTATAIVRLRDEHRKLAQDGGVGIHGLRLLDLLFARPIVNVRFVKESLDVSFATANGLVDQFATLALLTETTGQQRNRIFRYGAYLDLFQEVLVAEEKAPVQTTLFVSEFSPQRAL